MKAAVFLCAFAAVLAGSSPAAAESPYKPLRYIPRGVLYQEGGDARKAIDEGFSIVLDVKMTPDGTGLDGVDEILDHLQGGRRIIVRWKTEGPRSLPLFAEALGRHPDLFEKDYTFVADGPLVSDMRAKFIWPAYMGPYRVCETAAEALAAFDGGKSPIVVRDAAAVYAEMLALAAPGADCGQGGGSLYRAVSKMFLPEDAAVSCWRSVYTRVVEADCAADDAWRSLRTREEFEAHREKLRARMLEAIGPLPERTPLNFRTVRSFQRDGYRVDHVLFESMPGIFVPANLFVPTAAEFKPPFAAVVMSCGHGRKDGAGYRRTCVGIVRRGMVALLFDPYEQGERMQHKEHNVTYNHTLIGLKAMLLGSSMAALRIWDGMRAIDCVQSLDFVDPARIGYMGTSGGGTMTSYMETVDDRISAAAPSCYLTNFGYLCKVNGPQDGEQQIFGQLAFGLNHTGYVLCSKANVLVTCRYNDFFQYGGTAQLMSTVRFAAGNAGESGRFAVNCAHGSHGWNESTLQGAADWMSAHLQGRRDLLPFDSGRHRLVDFGFDISKADLGLSDAECGVLKGSSPFELPGATDIHRMLRRRSEVARAARAKRTRSELAESARRLAGVRQPSAAGLAVKEVGGEIVGSTRLLRLAFVYPDGFAVPATLLEPLSARVSARPVVLAGSKGRGAMLGEAEPFLAKGAAALIVDLSGLGDTCRLVHSNSCSDDTPEEDISIMLYLLGESMTGRRATELLFAADWLRGRCGGPVDLVAEGSASIAAAHAYAADRSLFASARVTNTPLGWSEYLDAEDKIPRYRYTFCVQGALPEYDWKELLQ